jgi:RNA recognition motif-containing protein
MDICVENLPRDVTGNDLREVFAPFGRVEFANVVKRRYGDEAGRLGFVGMPSHGEAASAVLGVHGRNIDGQVITAHEVRPGDPVSGACGPRCPCRGENQTPCATDRSSAESPRQGADRGADKHRRDEDHGGT